MIVYQVGGRAEAGADFPVGLGEGLRSPCESMPNFVVVPLQYLANSAHFENLASIKQWCEFPDQNAPEARYARYAAAQYAYGWTGTLSEEAWLERNRDTDSYSY